MCRSRACSPGASRPVTIRITTAELLRLRAQAQGFTSDEGGFLDVVRRSGGLQAQDATAGLLSARARTRALRADDTRDARLRDRTVVRTWAMRGTLHFVPAADLAWLLPLLGPQLIARDRGRLRQLGLDDTAVERGVGLVRNLLAERGPSSREAIRASLREYGLPAEGQTVVHLLYVAALQGHIYCSDDRGGGTYEFALLDDLMERGDPLPRPAALAELARRYLRAAGPAAVEDFVAWSALPVREARHAWDAIAAERVEVEWPGGTAWLLQAGDAGQRPPPSPIVRLLPRFDTYLLLHRTRDLIFDPAQTKRVLPGGGILNATVLVDGKLVGVWHLDRRTKRARVVVEPFETLSGEIQKAIQDEADDIERFLERSAPTPRTESPT
ncbi:MAG: winged helix DNA-binding domain-containing protein [Dehalococcoidia bacterium]